jgi:membrane protease YdiL (CAAX protease family)
MSSAALTDSGPGRLADDWLAARLRGFGLIGLAAFGAIYVGSLALPGLGALLVLIWAWRSRTPWPELGFSRPNSWVATITVGILLGLALRLVTKLLIMPLFEAPPNPAFRHLEGNTAALPLAILTMGFLAAFGEEVVMRGYFFERLRKLLGRGSAATALIIVVTSVVFGIGHYGLQGLAGAQHATIMGLVFGTLYAITARLWLPIVTHAAYNLAGLALIYIGVGPKMNAWLWIS